MIGLLVVDDVVVGVVEWCYALLLGHVELLVDVDGFVYIVLLVC